MNSDEKQQIVVRLTEERDALWRQCAAHTNEIVINTIGSKIFPPLDYQIKGLNNENKYVMFLEIHQVDDFRYKFSNGKWIPAGCSKVGSNEANNTAKKIMHPFGVKTGKQWMELPVINFDHVKMGGTLKCSFASQVYVNLMCKYVPVLSIYDVSSSILAADPKLNPVAVVKIDYTEFIVVKGYQNRAVASLKIATNPRAKRYRNGYPSSSSLKTTSTKKKQADIPVPESIELARKDSGNLLISDYPQEYLVEKINSGEQQQQIVVRLAEHEDALWRQFAALTNEMIITTAGRRIFPSLKYQIEGLDAEKQYTMFLEIHQVDDFRYKYSNGEWVKAESSEAGSEANSEAKKIMHADVMKKGKQWMECPVNFDDVRLSGNPKCMLASHIHLHSFRKYVPILTIYEVLASFPYLTSKPIAVAKIDYTEFIVVMRYRNREVGSLKSTSNPLSKRYCKKRPPSSSLEITPPQTKQADILAPEIIELEEVDAGNISAMQRGEKQDPMFGISSPQPEAATNTPPQTKQADILAPEIIDVEEIDDGNISAMQSGEKQNPMFEISSPLPPEAAANMLTFKYVELMKTGVGTYVPVGAGFLYSYTVAEENGDLIS